MACVSLAFIDGLGAPEMMLIFVIVLVLFGGNKLPEFARGLGKTIREFKKAATGVEEEFKRALEEDERKQNAVRLAASPPTPSISPPLRDPGGPDATYHPDEYHDHDYHADQTYGGEAETKPATAATPAGTAASPEAQPAGATPAASPSPDPATPPTATPATAAPNPEIPAAAAPAAPPSETPRPPTPTPPPPDRGNNPLPS